MLNKLKSKIAFFSLLTLITLPLSAEKILFSANRMTGQAGNTNTTTTLSGNAYSKTDSRKSTDKLNQVKIYLSKKSNWGSLK